MGRVFDNNDDIIDSRDVIARIEELESYIEDCEEGRKEAAEAARVEFINALKDDEEYDEEELVAVIEAAESEHEPDPADVEELRLLKELEEEASASPDWTYGETLIRDSYFEEYARQLADDLGLVNLKHAYDWPFNCIDWKEAAEELQADYIRVYFGGVDYWIRS